MRVERVAAAALLAIGCSGGSDPGPADSGRVAFQSSRANNSGDIFIMNGDGTGVTPVVVEVTVEDIQPDLSPDGSRIAFVSNRSGVNGIYVVNVDGTGLTPVVVDGVANTWPRWSPDGNRLLFSRAGTGLQIVNADGTNMVPVANSTAGDGEPSWNPDGIRIAFSFGGDIYVRWLTNLDRLQATTTAGFTEGEPSWSPDGHRIAYNRNSSIFIMDSVGAGAALFSSGGSAPAWAPDGRAIMYAGLRGVNVQILRRPTAGGSETPVATAGTTSTHPSWRPTP